MGRIARKIATVGSCLLLAGFIATLFAVGALRTGKYSQTDIYLGTVWVFVLSLIISSPLLIPMLRKVVN
ncbi:MAG: hypothetical protein QXR26_07115 [Candidatus Caldarchaeum sp.]